jgi:hypothetical protein
MKKIPVGATIAHAYRFAFADFFTVLRSIWLPLAVQLGLSTLLIARFIPLLRAIETHDPSFVSMLGPILLLYPIVLILFFAQFAVVTKVALGLQPRIQLIDFPFRRDTWRLLGGFIVAGLAVLAIMIAFAMVAGLLGFVLGALGAGKTALLLMVAIAILVGYGGAIFLVFRFMFLLAPVNLAEQRLGIGRAWQLSHGNFWRSFLIVLAIILPVAVAEYALIFAVIGLPPMPHGLSQQAFEAARLEWNISLMQAMATYWYVTMPLFLVVIVLYLGAGCAAQAFAYRKLTGDAVPIAAD